MKSTQIYYDTVSPYYNKYFTRKVPRKIEQQDEGYQEKFDHHTLFYDTFISEGRLIFIGPPLDDKWVLFDFSKVYIDGVKLDKNYQIYRGWKVHRSEFILPDELLRQVLCKDKVEVSFELGEINYTNTISTRRNELFKNSDVVLAINHNNNKQWIRDWLTWNVSVNGHNGAIIFDNSSTYYSVEKLGDFCKDIPGLDKLMIVNYPVKFGPIIFNGSRADSDYGQSVMIELARHKYLSHANTLTHVDLDEYIYPKISGGRSLVEAVKKDLKGYIDVKGDYVANVFDDELKFAQDIKTLRAKDFYYANVNQIFPPFIGMRKYIVDLKRIPRDAQLWIHGVTKITKPNIGTGSYHDKISDWFLNHREENYDKIIETSTEFHGSHIRPLTDNWRDNGRDKRYFYDSNKGTDIELVRFHELLREVFGV